MDRLTVGGILIGHQTAAQQRLGGGLEFVGAAAQLDAARLAATASVDLGLDDPTGTTQFGGRGHALIGGGDGQTARGDDAKFAQYRLGLIFVQVHEDM